MAFASIVPDLYPNDCNCLLNLWIGCKFRKIFSCLMLHNHPEGFQFLLRFFHYLRLSVSDHAPVIIAVLTGNPPFR